MLTRYISKYPAKIMSRSQLSHDVFVEFLQDLVGLI